MRRSAFMLTAMGAVAGAVVAPFPTPAAKLHERQDGSVAPLPVPTGLGTDPAASSKLTRTFAYFSGGQTEGVVLWAPFTYRPDDYTFTSSGQFWRGCSKTYYQTVGTSVSADTECPLFTTCSDGWLKWSTKSVFCVQAGSSCYTDLLYETYGATDALSWLYCNTASTDVVTAYRTQPPANVPATTTNPSTSINSPSSTQTGPTSTTSTTSTSTPPPEPKPKNNAGIIAGSVVGGVAVIALAAVAIFYILRRGRNTNAGDASAAGAAAAAAPPTYPEYQAEKPPAQGGAEGYYAPPTQGEYNPHTSGIYSVGSTSPTIQSAVPAYEPYAQGQGQGQHVQRNELPS
ncbi:uncharacterized protein EI97DRAFT_465354 [Westerdykella ornata]|uniref:Mid2 domain-containing protein n=1 Tax=Westerdykella ornata TaxID=318751 RepID=A0A6A6JRW2_WESOR|nr:uncharacterized protein EI97DRAFT_465354 [Westerdykella ornata]KAF2279004.1 hypothetical protein EI97DRAFT_465354 [Westerdykella ornata]